jgi:hypothetical protein
VTLLFSKGTGKRSVANAYDLDGDKTFSIDAQRFGDGGSWHDYYSNEQSLAAHL